MSDKCRRCGVAIPDGMLACRKHWYDLPRRLREMVLMTYHLRDFDGYADCLKEADRTWDEVEKESKWF